MFDVQRKRGDREVRTNLETPRVPPRHPAGRNWRRAAAQIIAVPVGAVALLSIFLSRRSKRARHDEALLRLGRELCQDVARTP